MGDELPRHLVLEGAVPNPFNPLTDIEFSLPRDAAREPAASTTSPAAWCAPSWTVRNGPPAHHSERWDGRNESGLGVASGVYFARLLRRRRNKHQTDGPGPMTGPTQRRQGRNIMFAKTLRFILTALVVAVMAAPGLAVQDEAKYTSRLADALTTDGPLTRSGSGSPTRA